MGKVEARCRRQCGGAEGQAGVSSSGVSSIAFPISAIMVEEAINLYPLFIYFNLKSFLELL